MQWWSKSFEGSSHGISKRPKSRKQSTLQRITSKRNGCLRSTTSISSCSKNRTNITNGQHIYFAILKRKVSISDSVLVLATLAVMAVATSGPFAFTTRGWNCGEPVTAGSRGVIVLIKFKWVICSGLPKFVIAEKDMKKASFPIPSTSATRSSPRCQN